MLGETKQITVTEEDLDKSIKILNSPNRPESILLCCVMSVATQRNLDSIYVRFGYCDFEWYEDESTEWMIMVPEEAQKCNTLVKTFDRHEYDAVRAMLPATFTFEKTGEDTGE